MFIEAKDIKKNYIRKRSGTNILEAVKETNLTLEPGTVTVVSGRSGSGKSTLLNMLCGILPPDSGQVNFSGTDIYALEDQALSKLRNEHFGIVPQGQSALMSLTVYENILLPFTLYMKSTDGLAAKEKLAYELMERLSISDLRDIMPEELSGGELRRMAICRAFIMEPEVIFADEPTGDLDDENTALVLEVFREAADRGTAVFMVSHDADTEGIADLSFRMNMGVLNIL